MKVKVFIFLLFSLMMITLCYGKTDPNDLKVLNDFRKGLKNPELLKWPENGDDPCGPPQWSYVFCNNGRVTQIQAKNLGLKGSLPSNFNHLSELQNLGLQRNNLSGMLPSLSGLSKLQYAYLDYNEFDGIPIDFFEGLDSLQVLSLEVNPLNATNGTLSSLSNLRLSGNRISGEIPVSFGQSSLQVLWLNNQQGGGMTGSIDVIASMTFLTQVWLHGNKFTGTIPSNIGNLTSLRELNVNGNQLVGMIPDSLANMELQKLELDNNMFVGPIPKFKATTVSYASNSFCQSKPGLECDPNVNILLNFLSDLNYPSFVVPKWVGNDPCGGSWFGLSCIRNSVSIINLPRKNLTGTLSPSLAMLDSLLEIKLSGNNITGKVPSNFTELKSLRLLDLSDNNFEPPLPNFRKDVKVIVDGNPLFDNQPRPSPAPILTPPPLIEPPSPPRNVPQQQPKPPSPSSDSPQSNQSRNVESNPQPSNSNRLKTVAIVVGGVVIGFVALSVIVFFICCCSKKNKKKVSIDASSSAVAHAQDPSDPKVMVKFAVSDSTTGSLSTNTGVSSLTNNSGETESYHVIESGGNLVISVQVLRKVTNNFASENELGRGGFGTVYKGELEDGTKIAVKRMECGTISSKGLDEFQAEIAVLSKVRHRHLVSLLGYSIEGNERLLVYEYMPLGALSRHLFHWKSLNLDPLTWSQRLVIALDVARAVEYLHSLARQIFIHRDLKSSNILLGDDIRAKVADFGLVKLAPDGEKSMATKLAGTFGYLAPEYAVMGKITTKVDVFSYGVVLMELLTGLIALDESRPEENRYLAEWFWQIKSNEEKLKAAIDPSLEVNEETFESISIVAELAGHCTAREASHRPDMGHAVKVLSELVEKWRPVDEEFDYTGGIDFCQPLPQMLKIWKEAEGKDISYASSTNDSKGSIPAKPSGFADSFTSSDAR
ncbi:unnamed protein product [Lathyrus oleraceus]